MATRWAAGWIVAIGLGLLPGASALAMSVPVPAEGPPANADTQKDGRIFIDTPVGDVRVGRTATVATLRRSAASPCGSQRYLYERDRPRWQAETGRLMVAMKEKAIVRVSFSCRDGYQSINAIQFLTSAPAGPRLAETPRRSGSPALQDGPRVGPPPGAAPLPF